MLFRWLFIHWLQQELDSYVYRINNTRKRHDKNKVRITSFFKTPFLIKRDSLLTYFRGFATWHP